MKKVLGIVACAVCLSACVMAHADSLAYDAQSGLVSFTVEDTGRATAYADKVSGSYFYAKEIDSKDGKITDSFRIPEDILSGQYTLSVVSDSGETEFLINHINVDQVTNIDQIINAQTATDIKNAINNNISDLGISAADFATYGDAVSAYLAAANDSTDAADFWNDYHTALLLAKTTGATDVAIDTLLSTEGEYLGFDYNAFSSYPADVKNAVYAKLTAGTLTENNLSDLLDIWVGLARLNDEESKSKYEELLTNTYATVLGIDVSKFTGSTRKDEIIGEIMAPISGYATASAVVSAYDAAIIKYPNPSDGGAGGGGGTPSTSEPTVAVPNDPTVNEPEKEAVFSDVDGKHWARDIIAELKERGIISGSDGKFNPNSYISRAEFCTMIAQSFYKGEAASGTSEFGDVRPGDWFYPYTILLAEKGIVSGVGDGNFAPNSMITREDAAVIAMRCLSSKINVEETDYITFIDADRIADYARTAVATLCSEEILSGTPEGMFYPKNNLTRAEAAVVIFKLLERLEA